MVISNSYLGDVAINVLVNIVHQEVVQQRFPLHHKLSHRYMSCTVLQATQFDYLIFYTIGRKIIFILVMFSNQVCCAEVVMVLVAADFNLAVAGCTTASLFLVLVGPAIPQGVSCLAMVSTSQLNAILPDLLNKAPRRL